MPLSHLEPNLHGFTWTAGTFLFWAPCLDCCLESCLGCLNWCFGVSWRNRHLLSLKKLHLGPFLHLTVSFLFCFCMTWFWGCCGRLCPCWLCCPCLCCCPCCGWRPCLLRSTFFQGNSLGWVCLKLHLLFFKNEHEGPFLHSSCSISWPAIPWHLFVCFFKPALLINSRNQSGCDKAKIVGFLPFGYSWPFSFLLFWWKLPCVLSS